jgi:hypothetical protein
MVVGLAFELHVPAQGDGGDPAVGVAPLEADEALAEAEGEDEHPHAEGLGRDQVPELVHEDDDAEDEDEGEEGGEHGLLAALLADAGQAAAPQGFA